MIANNDMHDGNLSFRPISREEGTQSFDLAPIYDMLPMALAPRGDGRLPLGTSLLAHPRSADLAAVRAATSAALAYWHLAASDPRLSPAFRDLCVQHHDRLRAT